MYLLKFIELEDMKLPKELQKKKSNRGSLTVLDAFESFNKNYSIFSKKSNEDKLVSLDFLVLKINIDENRVFYFYNLIKEKFKLFISNLRFKCMRCEDGCCRLVHVNNKISSGIVKEDFIQLRKNNIDTKGCISLIDEEIISSTRGFYIKELKTKMEATGLTYCYYYDLNKRLCKIYNDRPLFCYLFPFSLHSVHLGCPGLSNIIPNKGKSEKEREKEINNLLSINKLFWEFKIATLLYIEKKAKIFNKKAN